MDPDRRILLLTPTGRDTRMTRDVLARAGFDCTPCADVDSLCAELEQGAGALLVAEEALRPAGADAIAHWLDAQPPWSDLPLLLLAHPGANSSTVSSSVASLRNVTVLERPLRVSALVSAVQTALRARARQHELRAHLQQLEHTQAELRTADRRKDEFLAMLAHELRNPLAPVRTALDILEHRTVDPTIGKLHRMMSRQIDSMVRLVDDLLEVSRFTRGKIVLEDKVLDLGVLVQRAIETSHPLIRASEHQLQVDIAPDPVWVRGDAIRLTQVFSNLLNNAAKYTPPRGAIRVRVERVAGKACVSVTDTGIGLSTDMIDRVFDLFMQVGQIRTPVHGGGLGIGLTLVKGLVEQHGGTVTAASPGSDQGATFTVRLPLASPSTAAAEKKAEVAGSGSLRGLRVLVADDNRDAADSLVALLESLGARVETAYDGRGAVATLLRGATDVALLDIGMPDLTGYEVAERVRAAGMRSPLTLIAVTGWGQESDRQRARLAGFDHHLVKPVEAGHVRTLLAGVRHPPVPTVRTGTD